MTTFAPPETQLESAIPQSEFEFVKNEIQRLLINVRASSSTLYVEDPQTGDLRMIHCPQVKYPEPLFGLALPRAEVADLVSQGGIRHVLDTSQETGSEFGNGDLARKIAEKANRTVFHHLVRREGIAGYIRSHELHRSDSKRIAAVLYVNFSEIDATFLSPARKSFSEAISQAVQDCLKSIVDTFNDSDSHLKLINSRFALDSRKLTLILSPLEQLIETSGGDADKTLHAAFSSILRATLSAFEIDHEKGFASVHLLSSDKCHLTLAAGTTEGVCEQVSKLEIGQGIISWVFAKRQAICINDINGSEFARQIYQKTGRTAGSEIAAPMLVGNDCVGVINVESPEKDAFTPADLHLLCHAAQQAAIACMLYKGSVMSSKIADLLDVTTRHVSGTTDVGTVLGQLAVKLAEWLKWDHCAISCYDSGTHKWEYSGTTFEQDPDNRYDPREYGWSEYIRNNQVPVFLGGIDAETGASDRQIYWNETYLKWQSCRELHGTKPSTVNETVRSQKVRTQLGLPLKHDQKVMGVVWLKSTRDISDVSIDMMLATALAKLCSSVAESALKQRILQAFAESRIERQQLFFPTAPIRVGCVEGYVISDPHEHQIGGDFYRILKLADGSTGVVVGDTEGHGPMATIDMLPLYAATQILEASIESPSYFIKQLHAFAIKMKLHAEVIAFTVYRHQKRTWLNVSSAGSLVLTVGKTRKVSGRPLLDAVSFPNDESAVGRSIGCDYLPDNEPLPIEQRIEINEGDIIVAITDGILDAQGKSGEQFGDSGVKAILSKSAKKSPREIAESILNGVRACAGGDPHDDLTILVLKVLPLAANPESGA